jgi:hypothetical protein
VGSWDEKLAVCGLRIARKTLEVTRGFFVTAIRKQQSAIAFLDIVAPGV